MKVLGMATVLGPRPPQEQGPVIVKIEEEEEKGSAFPWRYSASPSGSLGTTTPLAPGRHSASSGCSAASGCGPRSTPRSRSWSCWCLSSSWPSCPRSSMPGCRSTALRVPKRLHSPGGSGARAGWAGTTGFPTSPWAETVVGEDVTLRNGREVPEQPAARVCGDQSQIQVLGAPLHPRDWWKRRSSLQCWGRFEIVSWRPRMRNQQIRREVLKNLMQKDLEGIHFPWLSPINVRPG